MSCFVISRTTFRYFPRLFSSVFMATTRAPLDIWDVFDQCNLGMWTDSRSVLRQFNENYRIPVDQMAIDDTTVLLSKTKTQLQLLRNLVGDGNQQAQEALTKLETDITFVKNLLFALGYDGSTKKFSLGYSHTDVFQEKTPAEVDSH